MTRREKTIRIWAKDKDEKRGLSRIKEEVGRGRVKVGRGRKGRRGEGKEERMREAE